MMKWLNRTGASGRVLGGLTFVLGVVVAIVGAFGSVQAVQDLVGDPTAGSAPTVAVQGPTLELVGARGEEVTFYLTETSPNGLWAAPDGLRLELGSEQTGFGTSAQVVPPKQKDWKDPVFTANFPFLRAFEDLKIRGSFSVPDPPGPETQMLMGRITGEFLYPGATEDGMHFSTVYRNLHIRTAVKVVSVERSGRIRSDFRRVRYGRLMLGLLYFAISIGYAISYGMWRDREQKHRWEPLLTMVAGSAVWACFAALWLKPFGT